jgi:hypothetical protein
MFWLYKKAAMLDYLGIFRSFNDKKIRYVVIGGLAVNFHGVPRMTYDVDVLLDLEDKNLTKFLGLLKKWGFRPKIPVSIMDFSIKNKREDWIRNRNMKAFNLVNPNWAISEIDIVIDSPVDYKKAAKDMKYIDVNGVLVPTISMRNLILMKKKAGRIQDKEDIKSLKKISK